LIEWAFVRHDRVMARPTSNLRLKKDQAEQRREDLGYAQDDLPVSPSTYREWLAGKPATVDKAEELAAFLRIGLLEIFDGLPDGYAVGVADPDEPLAPAARSLRNDAVIGGLVRGSSKFTSYVRHIALRFVAPRGYTHHFEHDGKHPHRYAELVLRRARPEVDTAFIFAFKLGVLRIDYGEIRVVGTQARVFTNFAACSEPAVELADPSQITVWTWFGKETCKFLVRSREDFSVTDHLEVARRDPDARPPGVLCFRAAPHHEREAGLR
jgi:hypothetical protein